MVSMRFPYTSVDNLPTSLMPRLTFNLSNWNHSVEATGLLDTGSAVSILPYRLGLDLGFVWEAQTTSVPLVGSLGNDDARAVALFASHPQLLPQTPVQLVFAWTRSQNAPLIFGQMNFFLTFDVCFFRSQAVFEIIAK